MNEETPFGLFSWFHLAIVIGCYASPFLFSWVILTIALVLGYIQEFLFKGCVLTKLQFKNKKSKDTFHNFLFNKIGLNLNKEKVYFVSTWIIPGSLFVFSLLWQVVLGVSPVII